MADIVTFGCRLNIHDSEAIRLVLDAARPQAGDELVVVNSCAVTEEAGRQARQAIRRLRRERPAARLVVTGCGAEVETGRFAAMTEVDHVLGNADKLDPAAWRRLEEGGPRILASDIMARREMVAPPIERFTGRVRGFVQIQTGCDHRCTFCVIPFGRGNSRSLSPGAAVAQVRRLVEAGAGEVVLTGVDLTSYDGGAAAPRLGALVRRILREVPDLARLRLSSIDSVEADADLLAALAEEERLMPHLHLSLQAGDDLILKRMKRRHCAADVRRFCAEARRLRPDIAFGADIIAGFPTETEAMFQRSLDLLEACDIVHLHAFAYSPRPGTAAARMPPVPPAQVKTRALRLREAGEAVLVRRLAAEVGAVRAVLVEHGPRSGDADAGVGGVARSGQFFPVRLDRPPPAGTRLRVRITGHEGRMLAGRPEPAPDGTSAGEGRSFGTFEPQKMPGGLAAEAC